METYTYSEQQTCSRTLQNSILLRIDYVLEKVRYQAISDLAQKYRPIVWLLYTTLLNFREIGCILHIPESMAKLYFYRAKVRLRESLEHILD
jgi:DNA-directed RNA polymerase specialized sigma24 family protein